MSYTTINKPSEYFNTVTYINLTMEHLNLLLELVFNLIGLWVKDKNILGGATRFS
jgi:putative NADPH-quinone reductase